MIEDMAIIIITRIHHHYLMALITIVIHIQLTVDRQCTRDNLHQDIMIQLQELDIQMNLQEPSDHTDMIHQVLTHLNVVRLGLIMVNVHNQGILI
jgi:hypothetical protein